MKISIKNFGPIHSFDFDLSKDFNVIFGKNNIGKSYAISAIYLIIKNLINENNPFNYFNIEYLFLRRSSIDNENIDNKSQFVRKIEEFDKEINKKLKNDNEIEITSEIENILSILISEMVVSNIEKSFKNSFSSIESLANKFTKENLSIELLYNDFSFSIVGNGNNLIISNLKLRKTVFVKKNNLRHNVKKSDDKIIISFSSKNNKDNSIQEIIIDFYAEFRNEVRQIIDNVYFLPASRSGLYQALSTFSAVIAELSKNRSFLNNKIELPSISEPVSDYFLYLSNISSRNTDIFSNVVSEIEKDIIKGEVKFSEETKKIVFSPSDIDIELDLSFTSSMISEIAPIVAYLKYIVSKKEHTNPFFELISKPKSKRYNLIFIEEPEAHLHPEVQVRLLEMFCNLVNLNVKVVMTSHSNYMFNELSNLILENKIAHEKVACYHMTMTEQGSIDSKDMLVTEEGIDDNNFVATSEKLYEKRMEIYEKLNAQSTL